jgi:hypothetical protein
VRRLGPELRQREAADLDPLQAAGQALRALPHQVARSAPQDQETRRLVPAVGQHSEDRKEVGPTLDLVDHDQAPERLEGGPRLVQAAEAHRVFQVEVVGRLLG